MAVETARPPTRRGRRTETPTPILDPRSSERKTSKCVVFTWLFVAKDVKPPPPSCPPDLLEFVYDTALIRYQSVWTGTTQISEHSGDSDRFQRKPSFTSTHHRVCAPTVEYPCLMGITTPTQQTDLLPLAAEEVQSITCSINSIHRLLKAHELPNVLYT